MSQECENTVKVNIYPKWQLHRKKELDGAGGEAWEFTVLDLTEDLKQG